MPKRSTASQSSGTGSTIWTMQLSCTGRALGADPSNVSGHYNLGRALAERGQIDRAIQSYHRAIELAPEDADAHQSLARALVMQNQLPKRFIGIAARSKSIPIAWARCSTWRGLSRPRRIVELRVPAEGVRLAERAVRLTNGTNATALDTLAAAYAGPARSTVRS